MKENQKELLDNCRDIVRFTKPLNQYKEQSIGHGRIEERMLWVYAPCESFITDEQWHDHIKTICLVERTVHKLNTRTKQYVTSQEVAFYIANSPLTAQQSFAPIKKHWLIENSNHHVRDVSFLEDLSRIRTKAENMARLRSFALNIMRKNNVQNIKGEMYQNSLSLNRLYSYQHFL